MSTRSADYRHLRATPTEPPPMPLLCVPHLQSTQDASGEALQPASLFPTYDVASSVRSVYTFYTRSRFFIFPSLSLEHLFTKYRKRDTVQLIFILRSFSLSLPPLHASFISIVNKARIRPKIENRRFHTRPIGTIRGEDYGFIGSPDRDSQFAIADFQNLRIRHRA